MAPVRPLAEPFRDLVEESLDEAVFLWKRWEAELGSLTRNVDEVWSWVEDRLQGALDGVRVGGDHLARQVMTQALNSQDPASLTVCAHILAAAPQPEARDHLIACVRDAQAERLAALARGMETADLNGSFVPVATLLANLGPAHAAALCRVKTFHRAAPGRELAAAFESKIPALQIEALRAVPRLADGSAPGYVAAGLDSDDPAVRSAAIESGVRAGIPGAWEAAVETVQRFRPESAGAMSLLAMLGGPSEHQLVTAALRRPELQKQALFALGFVGTPEVVEICIAGMRDERLARCAGETYCAVTGADLETDGLAAPEREDDDAPVSFEKDDLEADLVPNAEDLWPIPDPDAVRDHWSSIGKRFQAGVRHLRGTPVNLGTLMDAVETAPMFRRPAFALELAVRTRGKYDLEVRAFRDRQRRMMAEARRSLAVARAA